jgi:hypothetical protein
MEVLPRVCVFGKGPTPSNCEIVSHIDLLRNPSFDVIGLVYTQKTKPVTFLKKLGVLRIIVTDPSEDPTWVSSVIASSKPIFSLKTFPLRIHISDKFKVSGTVVGAGEVLTGVLQSNHTLVSARNSNPVRITSVRQYEYDVRYPRIEAPSPLAELITEPSDLEKDDILYLYGTSGPSITAFFEIYIETLIEDVVTVTLFNSRQINCKVLTCIDGFKTIFTAILQSEVPVYLESYQTCPRIGRITVNQTLPAIVHRIIY